MRFLFVGLLAIIPLILSAQGINSPNDTSRYHFPAIVVDGDTIPVIYFDGVNVAGRKSSRNTAEAKQWERLVRNVKKAYPYAKLAGIKYDEYSFKIANVSGEKKKKEMMKQAEDEIEAQFGKELRDLTVTQGKILLKLIDRQTNASSYEILIDFRGHFRTFFYQSFARLFGYDLKVKYDPLGEDADIERIVIMIESGAI